jgi:hypothetical protein
LGSIRNGGSARLDTRKALIQEEVSAINTAYLRAQLCRPERQEVTSR